jgi:hypothetical protein
MDIEDFLLKYRLLLKNKIKVDKNMIRDMVGLNFASLDQNIIDKLEKNGAVFIPNLARIPQLKFSCG